MTCISTDEHSIYNTKKFFYLYRMMREYSYELRVAALAEGKENSTAQILMGEMYQIYYNNRDLR